VKIQALGEKEVEDVLEINLLWIDFNHSNIIHLFVILFLLSSCSHQKDKFTLIEGEIILTIPYSTASVSTSGNIKAGTITPEEFQKQYGTLIATTPEAGTLFTLYFITGTTTLTPESLHEIPLIKAEIERRKFVEIEITGHADQTGDYANNDQLSLSRAELARSTIENDGIYVDFVRVIGRGSRAPLIDSPGKDEPKNRRVEILVR